MKLRSIFCVGLGLALANLAFAGGDAAQGEKLYGSCVACHGANGISTQPIYPNLAGQKEAYIAKQLKAFKAGDRKDPTMNAMVAPLTDADIANLAAYYSSLK